MLDIDAKSRYHNKAQLDKLLSVLAKAGLCRSSLYRSSFSGGWHLYLFFDEAINSAELYKQMVALLTLSDFKVGKGQLEVFPNPGQSSLGMGLRLPLQQGWAWLDKETLEVELERFEISATKALELFLDVLDSDANSFQAFRQLKARVLDLEATRAAAQQKERPSNVVAFRKHAQEINGTKSGVKLQSESSLAVCEIFHHLPPGINAETWCQGRVFHIEGLSGPSQRAEAIFSLGHYFFYGDPSRDLPALGYGYEEERKWAIREFLDARHNGCSEDINRARADAVAQVDRAAHWRPTHKKTEPPKKWTPNQPISWIRKNANRKVDARKRIQDALEGLVKLGRSFTTVELHEAAQCSRQTLYKHQDIWRQEYEDLAAGFFASCTHEYNAVVGAACSESKPPATVSENFTPPGLLAARRIAYELSLRSKRDIQRKQKSVFASSEASVTEWRSKVGALTALVPSELTVEKLRALVVVLANYLSLAPYEEDAVPLLSYITGLKTELSSRFNGPAPPLLTG